MHKWAMFILFIAASVLGLSVIIFAPPTNGEEPIPEAAENEVQFIMYDFYFDKPEYVITAGETVKLTMINKTGNHGVLVQGTDINLTKHGETVEVTFDEPGTYDLYCSIMCGVGHSDMVAKLIVQEPATDGEPAADEAA